MRTTIEITTEQRARLLELAGMRGDKGFSTLVQEAIDHYLADNAARRARVDAALAVLGTMNARAANALEASVKRVRSRWR